MKKKIISVILLAMFSGTAFAHDDFWWGLGVGALLFAPPVYIAPPPQYYYPPPQPEYYYAPPVRYYSPRPHCYSTDMGGYYDYYGRYIPNMQQRCEYW